MGIVMYPKTFFDANVNNPEPGTCFVIMPFAKEFDAVFRVIQSSMASTLGFDCTRTDELLGGGNIIEDILKGIATSELVLADLTGRNPNVYYELGLAHMSKPVEKVVLLSQELDSIPFDLRQYRYLVYTRSASGLRSLGKRLGEAAAAVASPIHRIFVNEAGEGGLPTKLMGSDHCLYEFQVKGGLTGYGSTKLFLEVTRHIMERQPRVELAFADGIGISLGERRPLANLDWDLAYERAPDGRFCFRVLATERASNHAATEPASRKAGAPTEPAGQPDLTSTRRYQQH
jgi:hypothetical protein